MRLNLFGIPFRKKWCRDKIGDVTFFKLLMIFMVIHIVARKVKVSYDVSMPVI
jgi:hypothetical protein